MNGIFEANRQLQETLRQAGVNSVQLGEEADLDLDNLNVYPHAHIFIESSRLTNNSFGITWTIALIDQVNKGVGDKDSLGRNDNYEDVFHNLLKVVNLVNKQFAKNSLFYSIESPIELTAISKTINNCVGWVLTLSATGGNKISIPNCP